MGYKITESILNDKILNKLLCVKLTTMNKDDLNNHKDKKIILAEDDLSNILSIAFIKTNDELNIHDELVKNLKWIYETKEDIQWLEKEIISKLNNNGAVINAIESIKTNKSIGTAILNYIKEKYSSVLLYAMDGAEEYWIKNGFEEIGDYYFVWLKERII